MPRTVTPIASGVESSQTAAKIGTRPNVVMTTVVGVASWAINIRMRLAAKASPTG